MHITLNDQIKKVLFRFLLGGIALFLFIGASGVSVVQAQVPETPESGRYYTVNPVTLSNGTVIEEVIINGPPVPPPGFDIQRQAVSQPVPDSAAGINILTVPAFNWVFGCSAVSGAMIAGYYDRSGWPNMYTGPTNGGVMPLNNSSWPTWYDGFSTYPNCPLIASKNGVDGRATRGSIDDYWVSYDSSAPDPYIANWTEHTWGDAIGDYMKTSQSAFSNNDGSTKFYNYQDPTSIPLTCSSMVTFGIHTLDGTYGRKLFYEARGYTVTDCYNQKTDNKIAGGFSYAQFKSEIDAGRPVMLNLEGHTVVGVGYDDATSLVYIHDTWDYNNHTMTWGGSYSSMPLQSVSIVNIQGPAVDGVCGTSNGGTFTSAPVSNLCSAGTPTGVSGSGPWTWSCTGTGGGSTAGCSANIQTWTVTPSAGANGSISPNTGQTVNHGATKTFIVTPDAGYQATMSGTCGGSPSSGTSEFTYTTNTVTANCSVTVTFVLTANGVCGTSNGGVFTSAPATALCNVGTPTTVNGSGPWTWSCTGTGGGSTASCFATTQQNATVLRKSVGNNDTYYALIQSAYNAASNGDDIMTQASDFNESLEFDQPVSVTFKGGRASDFLTLTGWTELHGTMTISNGTVNIENVIIL